LLSASLSRYRNQTVFYYFRTIKQTINMAIKQFFAPLTGFAAQSSGLFLFTAILCSASALQAAPPSGPFMPDQATLPVKPPAGAVVLFNGKGVNKFVSMAGGPVNWPVIDGALQSTRGKGRTNHIVSQLHFRDADIHVEFQLPAKGSGNSGLYIHGNYELQIINSLGNEEPGINDIGSVYGFSKPLVNACLAPGKWQVYDARYRAPRRNEKGDITAEGTLTVWLNGKLVQDGAKFGEPRSAYHPFRYGTTPYLKKIAEQQKLTMTGPLFLQDHDNPVRFRNVWIRPLDKHAIIYQPVESQEK